MVALNTCDVGSGTLDNPVLTAVEKSSVYFAGGGIAAGAVAGFLVGFFIRRRRRG
jgi:NhaP-type Na+/H+ or K+/H+ antiporter